MSRSKKYSGDKRVAHGVLHDQEGVAMVAAVLVLLVVGIVSTAAVTLSVSTNSVTRHDVAGREALAAADAGIQVATFRLNLNLASLGVSTPCITTVAIASVTQNSQQVCPVASTINTGNGGQTTFQISPTTPSNCAGFPLSDLSGISILQRCVTAVGRVNGVSARAQARLAAFSALPFFQNGVNGVQGVTVGGSQACLSSSIYTNGTLTANGSSGGNGNGNGNGNKKCSAMVSGSVTFGPASTGTAGNGSFAIGQPSTISTPYTFAPATGFAASYGTNNDSSDPGLGSCYVNTAAQPRTLVIPNGTCNAVTLHGGTYNFCNVTISGGSLTLPPGQSGVGQPPPPTAQIYVDSWARPLSGCNSVGTVAITGNGTVIDYPTPPKPPPLQLLVYGDPANCNSASTLGSGGAAPAACPEVQLAGNGSADLTMYAPNSWVFIGGNGTLSGAITGDFVQIQGNGFTGDSYAGQLYNGTSGLYYVTAWAQCSGLSAQLSPSDLTSYSAGC